MSSTGRTDAIAACRDLLSYLQACPTPFHCVEESCRLLEEGGFSRLNEREQWRLEPGKAYYTVRGGGSLLAFRLGLRPPAEAGFNIVGAHTDSPGLRLKPNLAKTGGPYLLLDVEVYGGPILATWTDRDLGLAGRLLVEEDAGGLEARLVRIDLPLCRTSNLAIHLDREVNERGLTVDRHVALPPAVAEWSGGEDPSRVVLNVVAEAAGVERERVRGHDLCLFDLQPPAIGGINGEMIFAARLDDLAMCHSALTALLRTGEPGDSTAVVALFDHEEIGSTTSRGAAGSMLRDVLARLVEAHPGGGGLPTAMAGSMLVSADMAHAVHPNRPDKHDGSHLPLLNGGPVIKTNANQRYATDGETAALFRNLCREASVPVQEFAMRADLRCGSSIGPAAAASLGVRTVDIGNPILSMHSIREAAGSKDPEALNRVLTLFLAGCG